MRNRGRESEGRIGGKIAGAAAAPRRAADTTRAYITRKSPGTLQSAFTIVLTALMIGVLFAPLGAGGIAAADAGDELGDHEPIPEYNFDVDSSLDAPSDASAWDVHASAYEGSTEVRVTTSDAGQFALEASDDRHHDGREIAVDAATLEDALGERPEMAHGAHSGGDDWTSTVEYRGGYAVVDIPRFSSNEITFEGTVSLSGDPAEDGTSYSYDLADSEDVNDFQVSLTGSTNEVETLVSKTSDGESTTESLGGTTTPTGPTGVPQLRLEGSEGTNVWEYDVGSYTVDSALSDGSVALLSSDGLQMMGSDGTPEWDVSLSGATDVAANDNYVFVIDDSSLTAISSSGGSVEWETSFDAEPKAVGVDGSTVYVGLGDGTIQTFSSGDGTEGWSVSRSNSIDALTISNTDLVVGDSAGDVALLDPSDGSEIWTANVGSPYITHVTITDGVVGAMTVDNLYGLDLSDGSEMWQADPVEGDRISLDSSDGYMYAGSTSNKLIAYDVGNGVEIYKPKDGSGNVGAITVTDDHLYYGHGYDIAKQTRMSFDTSISVDGDERLSQSGALEPGETLTDDISLDRGDHPITIDTRGDTPVIWELEYTESTETVNPTISVNGDTYQHGGTLEDGETTDLDVSEVSLESGTNDISVTVSEDYDGPTGQVGLNYTHAAIDQQTVDYSAEAWSERYDVSKTFAADQSDATLTIPHAGEVHDIREIETRENDGNWSTVDSSAYSLSNTTLSVEFGDVVKGTTLDVRTVASKVNPSDGEITVTDPTVLGDDLSSEIAIDEAGTEFAIGVGPTIDGNEIHYTHSESWSNPQSHARIGNDGSQELRLPNAGTGETTRISTVPLEAEPADGHVDVRMQSTGAEPEFEVRDSSETSEVEFRYLDANSGSTYQLYSLSGDHEVARGEASSPVSLTHDGTAETLAIFEVGSGGSGGTIGPTSTSGESPLLLIGLALGGLMGIYVLSRRFGDDSISGTMVLVVGSVLVGLLSIQAMAPGVIARAIGGGLEEALPLVLLGAIVIIVIWLRSRGDDVTLELGNSR